MNALLRSSSRVLALFVVPAVAIVTLFVVLAVAIVTLPGCASSGGRSAVVSELGPLVAEVAQARIAMRILEKSPDRAESLLAIARTIGALSAEAESGEITEALIRGWVLKRSADWQLTAPEQALLVTGLLAARDTALRSTGASTLKLGDPMLQPWLAAISRGIEAGVATYQAR